MKDLFLVVVALVAPLFFLGVYVMSARVRLLALREKCCAAGAELDVARDEAERKSAQTRWAGAAAEYDRARSAFPGTWFAAVLGFAPAQSLETKRR